MRRADAIVGFLQPLRARRIVAAGLLAVSGCGGEPLSPALPARLDITPETTVLAAGDIVRVAAIAVDQYGTPVAAGPIVLTTGDPSIATVDAASRLRAVAPGRTLLRGAASGLVDSVEIQVRAAPARLVLERYEGGSLPVLIDADSVDWGSQREYHEVFAVSGSFTLVGGTRPGYELLVRFEQYDVRYLGDERRTTLRLRWNEYDRGTVVYDAGGDLAMTSEIFSPLHHRATSVPGGFVVDYRIPGSDEWLELFYRR